MIQRAFLNRRARGRVATATLTMVMAIAVAGCSALSPSRRSTRPTRSETAAVTRPPGKSDLKDRKVVPTSVTDDLPPLPPLPDSAPSEAAGPAGPLASSVDETSLPVPPPIPPPPLPRARHQEIEKVAVDPEVNLVACETCGGDGKLAGLGSCATCGGSGQCVPGRKPCYPYPAHTFVGRFVGNLYQCLCCPDPCYQPSWVPEANAAFFQDYARTQTVTRIRYDHDRNLQFPDRNEFFWARAGLDQKNKFMGKGPKPPNFKLHSGKPVKGVGNLNFDQVYLYQEAGAARASFFVETPYRSMNTDLGSHFAGFADMNLGTKAMFIDCEILQLTFQFRTFLPTGSPSMGLGVGHVSLEPSLLMTLHLAPQAYFQGQIAEWIPIGGDPTYAGALLHYHTSLNQVLFRVVPDVPVIGTFEFNGWSFQDGAYTDPVLGPQRSTGTAYLSLGPGLRVSVCKAIDYGIAAAFPISEHHWAEPLIRSELRIIY